MTLTPEFIQDTLYCYDEILTLVRQFISNQATFNPERASWRHFIANFDLVYEGKPEPWLRVDERSDNQDDQLESICVPISELLGDWNQINTAAIDRQNTPPPDEDYQVYLRLKAKFEP